VTLLEVKSPFLKLGQAPYWQKERVGSVKKLEQGEKKKMQNTNQVGKYPFSSVDEVNQLAT